MSAIIYAAAAVLACQPATVIDGRTLQCEDQTVRLAVPVSARDRAALARIVGTRPVVCRVQPTGWGTCWTEGRDIAAIMTGARQ